MSWTDIENFEAGKLTTLAKLEGLNANLKFLHNLNYQAYFHDGTGADWTSTNTTLVAIDATKFQLTITTTGGPVLTWFQGSMRRNSATEGLFYTSINRIGDPLDPLDPGWSNWAENLKPIGLFKPYLNLPAGSHTFSVYWQIVGGTTLVRLAAISEPFFVVMEGI